MDRLFTVLLMSLLSLASGQQTGSFCYSYSGTLPIPKPAAFTACNSLSTAYQSCKSGPTSAFDGCFCNQGLFNSIIECGNEEIRCLDAEGDQAPQLASLWHAECDAHISFTPTTPAIASATITYGPSSTISNTAVCDAILSYCTWAISTGDDCARSYPRSSQSNQFTSCACQQPVLYAASVCEYDGNKTCFGAPAALSNIQLWKYCPASASESFLKMQPSFTTGIGFGLPKFPAPGQSVTGIASSSSPVTSTTPSPTMNPSSSPSPSSSTTGGGTQGGLGSKNAVSVLTIAVAFVGAVVMINM